MRKLAVLGGVVSVAFVGACGGGGGEDVTAARTTRTTAHARAAGTSTTTTALSHAGAPGSSTTAAAPAPSTVAATTAVPRTTKANAPASSAPPPAPPAAPTPAAPAAAVTAADLDRLLLTAVPAGYERQADDVGDTGPSDLDKAVDDDGEDDARAFLEQHGFVVGYQRLWAQGVTRDEDGEPNLDEANEIVVFIYAFRDEAGATAARDRYVGFMREGGDGQPFDVPDVPGAQGWTGSDEDGHVAAVLFTKGRFLVEVAEAGVAPDADVPLARSLARDQFGRL